MLLQSVRDLKDEVLSVIVQPSVAEIEGIKTPGKATIRSFSFAAGSTTPRHHRSIALGIARRGGEFKLAIRVQRQALMHSPMVERMVAQAKGEVDVRLIGRVDKRPAPGKPKATARAAMPWNRVDMRPMIIGASIGHHLVTAGTIGAFVKDKAGAYVLSNNHVLANENNAQQGDVVLQRAIADGGRAGKQNAAILQRWITLESVAHNTVDAAIALVDIANFDPVLLRGILNGTDQKLHAVAPADTFPVFKIGRTTGLTQGRITAFEVDNVVVGYEMGNVIFDNTIEIESSSAGPFSDGGDSGSLIINEQMEGIGLLFAGSDSGGSNGLGVTYANSLLEVLQRLRVELIT